MPLPTDRWTRAVLAPALLFIATVSDRNYQTDLWHHLARGRAIVHDGRLLDSDRFTYTVYGQPLRDVNWGWQVMFYQLHEWGGLPLVQAVNSLFLTAMMAVLVGLSWRRSGSVIAASAAGVFAFFGLWQLLIIRPQTLSLLLFVVLYGILEAAAQRRWLLILPPLLMALWVNVHGGFPIGLLLIGCFALADRRWSIVCCGLVSAAATLLNPYGWHVYEYVGRTSNAASARRIDEWLPPGLDTLSGKVWAASLLLLLVLFALSKSRPRRTEIVLLCGFLPLACGSIRMTAWWFLILAPILAAQLTALWPRLRQLDAEGDKPTMGNALACASIVAAMVLSLPWLEALNPALSRPGRAHRTETDLQAIADGLSAADRGGRIFTRFDWGEYLGWSLHPQFAVFMDGRIEIIPDDVWLQYSAVTRGRGDWEEVLRQYGVNYLVLDASGYHHDLLPLVERSPAWQMVCRRGEAVLFVRREMWADRRTLLYRLWFCSLNG